MKHYFVKYGDFANSYHVCCCESTDAEVNVTLRNEGYERITRKEAEALCRRERERRRETPSCARYATAYIQEAYFGVDGWLVFRNPRGA